MSAWMVSAESIAKIAAHMTEYSDFFRCEHVDYEEAFRKLEDMNIQALVVRYGDDPELLRCKEVPEKPDLPPHLEDMVQLYKTMRCYLYQCCEGNIDTTLLYEAVNLCSLELAGECIVPLLGLYEDAKWE